MPTRAIKERKTRLQDHRSPGHSHSSYRRKLHGKDVPSAQIAHTGSNADIVGEAAFSLDERLDAKRSGDLVVQDDIQECTVHSQPTVVLNEAQLPEPVHKETHARSRRPDHSRQRLLTDVGNHILSLSFLADAVFAPGYVDRTPAPGTTPDLIGFKQGLTKFRAAFPDLRYTATGA